MTIYVSFGDYEIGLADQHYEKKLINQMRVENYKNYADYLLEANPTGGDTYDEKSFVFYIKHAGRLTGTGRMSPMEKGCSELYDNLPELYTFPELQTQDPSRTLELSRLLINFSERSFGYHEMLFYYGAHWCLEKTSYKNFIGICLPSLVRLYKPLGARIIKSGLTMPNRKNNLYYLITGEFEPSMQTLHTRLLRKKMLQQTYMENSYAI